MLIIAGLIVVGGLAMTGELAVLHARHDHLDEWADAGSRGARRALDLARRPARLVAAVQAAVALATAAAGILAGTRVFPILAARLEPFGPGWAGHTRVVASAVVAVLFGAAWLVIVQLLPRRLAAASPERLALFAAMPLSVWSRAIRPVVWLAEAVTVLLARVVGAGGPCEPNASIEDIEHMLRDGTRQGLLAPEEQDVARRALRLGDRTVRDIMRPRVDIDALDVDTPEDEVIGAVAMSGFSRVPVHEGDLDHIIGFVYTKDLLRQQHLHWPIELRKLLRPPLFVPESLSVDRLLRMFRDNRTQMAIVLDEYGGTEGLVTMEDVLEQLVGEIHDEYRGDRDRQIVARDDGSWFVEGATNLDDLLARLGRGVEPGGSREFSTVAGLILGALGRLPRVGERIEWEGLEFEVAEMVGLRIERVAVRPGKL